MADTTTIQMRLSEAELAYHRLQTGTAEVEVQQDGSQVKYNLASVDKLRTYIADLRSQLLAAGALAVADVPRRRPLYVAL